MASLVWANEKRLILALVANLPFDLTTLPKMVSENIFEYKIFGLNDRHQQIQTLTPIILVTKKWPVKVISLSQKWSKNYPMTDPKIPNSLTHSTFLTSWNRFKGNYSLNEKAGFVVIQYEAMPFFKGLLLAFFIPFTDWNKNKGRICLTCPGLTM